MWIKFFNSRHSRMIKERVFIMEQKFFICRHCGNIIAFVDNKGVPVMCCGSRMEELIPGTVDASTEKHVPVVSKKCGRITVEVGSVAHPMEDAHYIEWIYLQTEKGGQRKSLKPGEEPKAVFAMCADDKPVAVYAYCNLHGLWVAQL